LRSVPRYALSSRPIATVTNLGSPAIEMSRHGPTGRTIPSGAIMWQGAVTLVAAATIPYFGFGLKMFAFAASTTERFQLRCGDVGLGEMLRNVPSAFRGEYFSRGIRDFLCDRVHIELDRESAIEAGGEILGHRRELEIGLGRPATVATRANRP